MTTIKSVSSNVHVITIVQQPWQAMLMDRLKFRKVWDVPFSRQESANLRQVTDRVV